MKIAVIGATGMVGRVMLKVLEEQGFNSDQIIAVASIAGREVDFRGQKLPVIDVESALQQKPEIAIFSAGSQASKQFAPQFAENGFVVDNSSAWRMETQIPLVVPEINADKITAETRIIANPNCSTIQMVLALSSIQKTYGIDRLVVSTYQSVTGSGMKGLQQLNDERTGIQGDRFYPHRIDMNLLPHGGDFLENGYTTEEMKLVHETRKIFDDNSIRITATVVRVPVKGGHSESVNIRLKKAFEINDIRRLIANTSGVELHDEPRHNIYPMPYYVEGKDSVYVGRVRRDESEENSLNMWIVADNLRKGAATNAVQIAKYIIDKFL
jgi:aspartate-semialdehyde dehydrogenase